MKLHNLKSIKQKRAKKIGRGIGSGKGGHTVGRGTKGQKSRTGYKPPMKGFEGGQNPLFRRLPKLKGFRRGYFKTDILVLNLDDINEIKNVNVINRDVLISLGLIKKSKKTKVKILGDGTIDRKVDIEGIEVSKMAKEKIEKAGGSVK